MARDASKTYPGSIFLSGDTTQLPFPDKTFDIVHSTRMFHHLSPAIRAATIREQLRVAAKAVIVEDLFGFEPGFWRWPHRAYYTVCDGSYYRFTLSEWRSFFHELGARIGEFHSTHEQMILNRCACWVLVRE
jgi:ubiquinone/menaquinone biosynthesis C-methylase UbiE